MALAMEERDTCQSCGFLKSWCRDPANFGAFEAHEEQCHATYAVAAHRKKVADSRDDVTQAAVQMWARFAEGREPDVAAGLGITSESDAS